MTDLAAEPILEDKEGIQAKKAPRVLLILTAWLGTFLLSRLPQIVLSELGAITSSEWDLWWWIAIGTALFVLTYIWATARSLRGYFFIMTMIYLVTFISSALQQTTIWTTWFGPERPWLTIFFGERFAIVLMALGLAGILALSGHKRASYFLALGNVNAPAKGLHLSWKVAGPLIALTLTAAILAVNTFAVTIADVIPLLPVVLILALMNAFGEEMAFRAAPLSQLWQVVGKRQAIWLMAVWFGLGHYYGGVSFGAIGVVYLTLVAVLFGKAMLETKGLAIPVFMHMCGDVLLYMILALGST